MALLAALLPSTGSTAREQAARVSAGYLCEPSSAAGESATAATAVNVGISATFPETGTPGEPIQPGALTVRVSLTKAAAGEVLGEDAATVEGSAALTTEVAQNDERARARWTGLSAAGAPVPDEGELELAHTGTVPPVTVRSPGDLTFTADRLDLTLRSAARNEQSDPGTLPDTTAGDDTPPGPDQRLVQLTCAPREGEDTRLASVSVPEGAAGEPDTPPSGSADAARGAEGGGGPEDRAPADGAQDGGTADGDADAPGIAVAPGQRGEAAVCPAEPPVGELDPERFPEPPPGSSEGTIGASLCAVPVGYATVRKQDGAVLINDPRRAEVGMMHLNLGQRTVSGVDYLESDSLGLLDFPDSASAFLTFGFQPVSARIAFETEPATVVNLVKAGRATTSVGYYQRLRLYDVRVNGVPLEVGDNCRSAHPMDTELTGAYPFMEGGLLKGEIDIPPFRGCGGEREDLDPLFTAAVSGPGNVLEIQQGPVLGAGTAPTVPDLPRR
ncbi:hypothetical protein LHJ74_21225 [Streptomyces sp. N2-109]|uniref:DUF6801 domain-containing protein n=1 Tax=Streptomyces gossypii TaxID=2883101 RepID=A0ABT2JWW4_9ACTN|nr:DUF6801 domain-containing protein [Streptomyces gossypii]MCT2592395.1 hypothetical protein [Streptomyces gossypii]